ncbi:HNH endonuclease [Arthrobacter phage Kumotta]|uniref:HNH endonuclease n=1 Tax=Arthrobacter phage Kumotta TaxID=2588498 RepID=A0A4Y6EPN4_9CAUD|nr:HNH endonuclease [Arthrobacter phage Kumotta]QDF19511.1 HNH endonuclease [Arthrobacter phage Kumotta]
MSTVAPSRTRKATSANSDPCIHCGDPVFFGRTSAGRGKMAHLACRRSSPARKRDAECKLCGAVFEQVQRSNGEWTQTCGKSCARKLEIRQGRPVGIVISERLSDYERRRREFDKGEQSRRRRRARLAGVEREPYTTASIAARDDYRCSLCGGLVDMALKWPEAGSASVDHILPISRGGADTLANVALAHFGCNLTKGNRL